MASALKLKNDIRKLKTAIDNKATNPKFLPKLKEQLEKLEGDLAKLKKPTKSGKKPYVRAEGSALAKLKNKLKSVEKQYKGYSGKTPLSLERDANRPAKPIGKRKSKSGNTYYEYRANRIDVKQPPRVFPKLEGGGETNDGKLRFDMYGYVNANSRTQDGDEIIRVSSYKEAEKKAEKFLEENKYQLVELYRKDDFVGSIRTKGNFVYSSRYKKEKLEDGGYMANEGKYLRTLPTQDDLYAFMVLDKKSGFGAPLDYKVYGKIQAKKIKEKYEDKIEKDRELKMFSVKELLDRKSFGAQNKQMIEEEFKRSVAQIKQMMESLNINDYKELYLEDGGYMEEGGYMKGGGKLSLKKFRDKYDENEDANMHSENVVLLAQNFGSDSDIRDAKTILAKHEAIGSLPYYLSQERNALHDKLWAKYQEEVREKGIKEDGGYMAGGGETPVENSTMKGKTITIKLPNETESFKDKVVEEYSDHVWGKKGVWSKKYIVGKAEDGGYMADGGMSQGYDDREDERLSMEHGKIGNKDFVGSHSQEEHSRRDDARFEERMEAGGEVVYEVTGSPLGEPRKVKAKSKDEAIKEIQDLLRPIFGSVAKKNFKVRKLEDGGYMAMGGATEHGIMKGDHVVDIYEDTLVIENGGKKYFVFIKTGEREQVAEKGGYMTHGGETHRSEKK